MPAIPETGWLPPKEFPNLSAAKLIGFDTETFDPELITHGAGWARGVGHMIGASISTEDGHSWYFPFGHEIQPELNMDKEQVIRFLKDTLKDERPKVGANLQYDVGWCNQEGIEVNGQLYDVQYAEGLLNEWSRDYSLEGLAQHYLDEGKESNELYQWLSRAYGGKVSGKQRANLYRSPPCLAGMYAESDADLPIRILMKQWPLLEQAGLLDLFHMECQLIPVLIGMRFRGVPYSEDRAHEASKYVNQLEDDAQLILNESAGFEVNVNAGTDLVKYFDKHNLTYPLTTKGNPSFTKGFLDKHADPLVRKITEVRRLNKARTTFIEGAILGKGINGKIYPNLHPLKGEQGGAGSGRFSSSNPNSQQYPSRDEMLAPLVRGIFVPEDGYPLWAKLDLSQIEYRLFAHESGDADLIRAYQDPKADFHAVVSKFLGDKLPRKPVKNYNFMSLYGGGVGKATDMVKADLERNVIEELLIDFEVEYTNTSNQPRLLAQKIVSLYEERFPAAGRTLQKFMDIAESTGEIRTLLNRRSQFLLYEPRNQRNQLPLPYDKALQTYGRNIKRALCYRGLNRRLQGSAADILKKGMLDAYKAGLFKPDALGFPHLTVHDELDLSYHPDLAPYKDQLIQCVEQAIPLKVPVIMDEEYGADWGHVD